MVDVYAGAGGWVVAVVGWMNRLRTDQIRRDSRQRGTTILDLVWYDAYD